MNSVGHKSILVTIITFPFWHLHGLKMNSDGSDLNRDEKWSCKSEFVPFSCKCKPISHQVMKFQVSMLLGQWYILVKHMHKLQKWWTTQQGRVRRSKKDKLKRGGFLLTKWWRLLCWKCSFFWPHHFGSLILRNYSIMTPR